MSLPVRVDEKGFLYTHGGERFIHGMFTRREMIWLLSRKRGTRGWCHLDNYSSFIRRRLKRSDTESRIKIAKKQKDNTEILEKYLAYLNNQDRGIYNVLITIKRRVEEESSREVV
jgi:hypothetical protein